MTTFVTPTVLASTILAAALATQDSPDVPRAAEPLDLERVATALDPGPRPTLLAHLPKWFQAALGKDRPARKEALAAAQGFPWWDAPQLLTKRFQWTQGVITGRVLSILSAADKATETDDAELIAALLQLHGAAMLGTANGEDIAALLATPGQRAEDAEIALSKSPFGRALLNGTARVDRATPTHMQELIAADRAAARELPAIVAHLTARLLRCAERDEHKALALEHAALLAGTPKRAAERLRWREEVVRLDPDVAGPWITLAREYCKDLDFARAAKSLAVSYERAVRVIAGEPDGLSEHLWHRRRIAVRELASDLVGLVRRAEGNGLEPRLATAEMMARRGYVRRAAGRLQELARAYPDDARPLVRLAMVRIADGDVGAAIALVESAQALDNWDASAHAIAMVCSGASANQRLAELRGEDSADEAQALKDELARQLRRVLEALAGEDYPLADTVRLADELGLLTWQSHGDLSRLRTELAKLLERADAVRAAQPEQTAAAQLVVAGALFSTDLDAAREALAAPLPPRSILDPDLALARAKAWLVLAFRDDQADWWSGLARLLVDAVEHRGEAWSARHLRVQANALAGLERQRSAKPDEFAMVRTMWRERTAAMAELLPPPGFTLRAATANTLGFMAWHAGDTDAALRVLTHASSIDENDLGVTWLNRLAIELQQGNDAARAGLLQLANQASTHPSVRVQARLWLAHDAAERGDDDAEREHCRAAVARMMERDARGSLGFPPLDQSSVLATGSLVWGVNYALGRGIRLRVQTVPDLWFVLTAPLNEAEARTKAEE